MNMSARDRLFLLATGLLAAYQVVVGIDHLSTPSIIAYTIGFGVLVIAGLLMIILGFEVLDSALVVIASTIIPLSLSLGLVWQHLPELGMAYLGFTAVGFMMIIITRIRPFQKVLQMIVLVVVHGVAGMIIFLLPLFLVIQGIMRPGFALVGLGGALIGMGGLLLSFLKAGKPILSRETILKILPGLLLLMTVCFVAGFALG